MDHLAANHAAYGTPNGVDERGGRGSLRLVGPSLERHAPGVAPGAEPFDLVTC